MDESKLFFSAVNTPFAEFSVPHEIIKPVFVGLCIDKNLNVSYESWLHII